MRVRDVGLEAAGHASGVAEERGVACPSAARVDDRTLELVAAGGELALEVRDEDAEVGVIRPWIHLGDEEDSHVRTNRDCF